MKNLYSSKSKIEGTGIFVKEKVSTGERIAFITGKRVKFDPKDETDSQSIPTWYGIGKTIWIDPEDTIFQYFNHSCNPNTAIVGTKTVVARRPIKADEEITIDYSMTDVDMQWELHKCKCKAKNCRKTIRSIQHLPPKIIKAHLPFIPKFFLDTYKRTHPGVILK